MSQNKALKRHDFKHFLRYHFEELEVAMRRFAQIFALIISERGLLIKNPEIINGFHYSIQ